MRHIKVILEDGKEVEVEGATSVRWANDALEFLQGPMVLARFTRAEAAGYSFETELDVFDFIVRQPAV